MKVWYRCCQKMVFWMSMDIKSINQIGHLHKRINKPWGLLWELVSRIISSGFDYLSYSEGMIWYKTTNIQVVKLTFPKPCFLSLNDDSIIWCNQRPSLNSYCVLTIVTVVFFLKDTITKIEERKERIQTIHLQFLLSLPMKPAPDFSFKSSEIRQMND